MKFASLAVYGGPSLAFKLTKPLIEIISRFLRNPRVIFLFCQKTFQL